MPESVTLDLPWPPADLNPNRARSLHWSAHHRAAAQYRRDCFLIAYDQMALFRPWGRSFFPLTPPITATVTFQMPNRRRRDLDNLLAAMKPAWDGLVDAGLLADDNADQLTITLKPPQYGGPAGVRLLLEPAERDDDDE